MAKTPRHDPPRRDGWAIAAVLAIMAFVNVADIRVAHASLVLGPAGAAGLLALGRWARLSWQELGLGRGTWQRGLVWAAVATGALAVVFAAGAALPLTRDAFRDARYQLGWERALTTAFVLIPLGTVLFEEVAFRGALWGLLRRARGTWTATVVSAALFGLWHVLPSLGLGRDNQAIGNTVGNAASGQVISVLGTVLFTGLAGVVFCELRRRSGSLLASAGLHWATNGLGVLAAAAVWAWASR
jgi:membrane protease YdiL (CAAX protease family)